jgi:hypothetical protein
VLSWDPFLTASTDRRTVGTARQSSLGIGSDTLVQWQRGIGFADIDERASSMPPKPETVMFNQRFLRSGRNLFAIALACGTVIAFAAGFAISAQDKYTLRVPNGLPFADFRGYENWQVVAVSQTENLLKVMVANPTMMKAYRAGIPGNGQSFPDGSKIAKIEWKPKVNSESPFWVRVPDTLQDVFLIEKDAKKYPDTKGWAYAVFDYDPATSTYAPDKTGTINCGFACHTAVAKKDYIFTGYGTR